MMKWILPFRFLSIVAQLVLQIIFISNRDFNVRLCTIGMTEDKYWSKDKELLVGLSLSIAFLLLEMFGFFTGITMLHSKQSLYSLSMHTIGSLSMLSFLLDGWECNLFWWIFILTVVLPFLTEFYVIIRTLLQQNQYGGKGMLHVKG